MAYLTGLNTAQLDAVTTSANVVQVLAPPGSGKTKTLTSRVAHLLCYREYAPWNVICLTFTIKSAREMKVRLGRLLGEETSRKVVLGTFHSVCRRYLSAYGHLIDVPRGFGIADSSDSTAIINRIVKRFRLTLDPRLARNRISNCKSKNIGPEQLYEEMASKSKRPKATVDDKQEFVTVYREYENHLLRSNLLDFDDLLLRCVELLREHPECIKNVQAVLIDEFQDTNHVQFDLMCLFARHCQCVTTVGDPDQSIYGWRNAEVANLSKMRGLWPEAYVINLEQNYRSAGCILRSAQTLIEQDTVRPQKALVPTHREGTLPVLRWLPTAEIESKWIVAEIQRWMTLSAGLLNHSDFAVLLRSSPLSRQIESAMAKSGIPYRMVGGMRFFDRVEVKILLDYLRVIAQPDNSDALSRIINVPSRRIGDATIKSLLEEATSQGLTMWAVIKKHVQGRRKASTKINFNQSQGLSSLAGLIMRAREKLENEELRTTPQKLIEFILKELDFKDYLTKEHKEDHEGRWENVEQLLIQADDPSYSSDEINMEDDEVLPDVEEVEQQTLPLAFAWLSKFLANVALATEVQSNDEDEDGKPRNTVTISTMHAAKGLEWPVVFIPACYTGSIPHSRAEDADEERRLLYVGMTRAQVMLNLSVPRRGFRSENNELSRFLAVGDTGSNFADAAPLLDYSLIEDVATILGRELPDRAALGAAVAECENLLDDQWPLDGSFDPEEVAEQWTSTGNSYGYKTAQEGFKRRKVSSAYGHDADAMTTTMYSKTTMQHAQSFTIPPANAGFMSAAERLRMQQEAEEREKEKRQQEEERRESHPPQAPSEKKPVMREDSGSRSRSTKRPLGQPSILGWFGQKGGRKSVENKEHLQEAGSSNSNSETHSDGLAQASRQSESGKDSTVIDLDPPLPEHRPPMEPVIANRQFRPVLPDGPHAAMRRPLNGKESDSERAGRGYMFLSSSPPPPSAAAGHEANREQGSITTSGTAVETITASAFQSASTLHSTTLGQLKTNDGSGDGSARNGTRVIGLGQGQQQPRRRLGMGGPFKPWRV